MISLLIARNRQRAGVGTPAGTLLVGMGPQVWGTWQGRYCGCVGPGDGNLLSISEVSRGFTSHHSVCLPSLPVGAAWARRPGLCTLPVPPAHPMGCPSPHSAFPSGCACGARRNLRKSDKMEKWWGRDQQEKVTKRICSRHFGGNDDTIVGRCAVVGWLMPLQIRQYERGPKCLRVTYQVTVWRRVVPRETVHTPPRQSYACTLHPGRQRRLALLWSKESPAKHIS